MTDCDDRTAEEIARAGQTVVTIDVPDPAALLSHQEFAERLRREIFERLAASARYLAPDR